MARVFISYRHVDPDQVIALSLYRRLQALDHDVFLAEERLKVGMEWDPAILAHVRDADWFIPLLSSTFFKSRYIEKEMRLAMERLREGALQGILPINVAFDGVPSSEAGKAMLAFQSLKWREDADTARIVEEIAQRIPPPLVLVKGMRPFEVTDARAFLTLGRQAELDAFLALLKARPSPLLLIHGTSGSGKTSFLRAGVMARLLNEGTPVRLVREPRPPKWDILAPGDGSLVFVDQFEQLLAHLGRHPEESGAFVDGLERCIAEKPGATWVLCLRDEYRTAFETVLPAWAGRATRFPLLSFAPPVAARVLAGLLDSAQVEYQPSFLEPLCVELAEGTPPTVKPALLQMLAQRCKEQRLALTPPGWAQLREGSGSLFEAHIRQSVLGRLRGPVARGNATRVLRTLTAGDLKSAPRRLGEVAQAAEVPEDKARDVLEAAADPHARVVHIEADAEARESYQLVHDLFAGAIERVHRDEARRWELWGRSAVAVVLAGLLVLALVLRSQAESQREQAEAGRKRAEAMSRRVFASKLTSQARTLLDWEPQRALLLLSEAVKASADHQEPVFPDAEKELRKALSQVGGLSLRFASGPKTQLAVGQRWFAVTVPAGFHLCRFGAASVTQDCVAVEAEDTYDFIGLGARDRWLITRGPRTGLKLWMLEEGKVSLSPYTLSPAAVRSKALVLSDDGTRLAIAGEDDLLRVVDLSAVAPSEQVLGPGVLPLVKAMAFSPGGHWLAVSVQVKGSPEASRVHAWNVAASPTPVVSFVPGAMAHVKALSISTDGRWLVTWGSGRSERGTEHNQLWDLGNPRKPVHARSPGSEELGPVLARFSPDGKWLAANEFTTLHPRLFRLDPEAHTSESYVLSEAVEGFELRFSVDGQWLVGSAYGSSAVQLWSLRDLWHGVPLSDVDFETQVLRGHEASVSALVFSLDGRWLVTNAVGDGLRMWPLDRLLPGVQPVMLGASSYSVPGGPSWLPESGGRPLFTSGPVPTLWEFGALRAPEPVRFEADPGLEWSGVQQSPRGRWLAGAGEGGVLHLMDLARERRWLPLKETPTRQFGFSPDERWLIALSEEGQLRLWELRDDGPVQLSRTLPGPETAVTDFRFVPGRPEVWLLRDGKLLGLSLAASGGDTLHSLDCAGRPMGGLTVSADGHWLFASDSTSGAAADAANKVQGCVWRLEADGPREGRLLQGMGPLLGGVFTPDSRALLTLTLEGQASTAELRAWSLDMKLDDWRTPPRPLLAGVESSGGSDWNPAMSPTGGWLFLPGCGQQESCLLPLRASGTPRPVRLGAQYTQGLFSPDGKRIALRNETEGRIDFWAFRSRSLAEPEMSLEASFLRQIGDDMAFSPDGHWLATENGNSVRLWPLTASSTSREPIEVRAFGGDDDRAFMGLAFTPDSQWLISREVHPSSSSGETLILVAIPVGPELLLALAARTAGRNLDMEEWRQAHGDTVAYRKTFSFFPAEGMAVFDALSWGIKLAREGRAREAQQHVSEAVAWATELRNDYTDREVCRGGISHGFASVVLPLCERNLDPDPESAFYSRGSRGIARALTGNHVGAAEDLRAYADWLKAKGRAGDLASRAEEWAEALSRGQNPVDDAKTLEQLRQEWGFQDLH
jgi:WD40 repeat protein